MEKFVRVLLIIAAVATGLVHAQEAPVLAGSRVRFATAEEAGKFLAEEDAYFRALNAMNRGFFLRSAGPVSLDDLKKHVAICGRDWTADEKTAFSSAVARLAPAADRLKLRLPAEILLIKTNGDEDFGSLYTRRNAIIFHEKNAQNMRGARLPFVLAHELFHVFSRHNPARRDAIYAVFGFEPLANPPEPDGWKERGILNPDAITSVHAIRAKLAGGEEVRVVPYNMSKHAAYDAKLGKSIAAYLEVVWIEVAATPRTFRLADLTDFAARTGGNTGYTIHPEEISADNFACVLTGSRDVRTPEKLTQLEAVLLAPAK